jgi:hypothetical protein
MEKCGIFLLFAYSLKKPVILNLYPIKCSGFFIEVLISLSPAS